MLLKINLNFSCLFLFYFFLPPFPKTLQVTFDLFLPMIWRYYFSCIIILQKFLKSFFYLFFCWLFYLESKIDIHLIFFLTLSSSIIVFFVFPSSFRWTKSVYFILFSMYFFSYPFSLSNWAFAMDIVVSS